MKKITINKINEDIYYEKLDNGMDVYMYINKNIHNNYVTFTTKYGSVYNEFNYNNKLMKVPNGIAHFLEHKVFVQKEDPQPEEFFGENGGLCNAYTTFKNTTYLFNSPEKVIENTVYLLDFVQDLYLTDDNVESEKGIITQEIRMCDDRPSDLLYDKIRENTIHNNPFKESIIGTVDEVNSITKELLEKCYKTFYHPGNMFLVVTGNFDREQMLKAIKKNQDGKDFGKYYEPVLKKFTEPDNVKKKYEIIKCNTNIPKVAVNFKYPLNKDSDLRRLSIYMFLIFNLLFGDTSEFDGYLKEKGIITNSLYYNLLNIDTHFLISLINSTDKYEELIKEIEDKLKNIKISKSDFERKKKVLISNEVFSYESIEMINDMITDNIIFNNQICDNIIEIIESLTLDEMNKIIKEIDFNNKSIVILKKG